MKIYIFKNLLNGKFQVPIFAETEEEMKFNMENHIRKILAEKKQFEIRMNEKRDLYFMGEYNTDTCEFKVTKPVLYKTGIEMVESVKDQIKKEIIENYKTQLEIKEETKNDKSSN